SGNRVNPEQARFNALHYVKFTDCGPAGAVSVSYGSSSHHGQSASKNQTVRRRIMTTKNARVIALVFAMAAAVFASRVDAQQISAERAAALQKCNTEAD